MQIYLVGGAVRDQMLGRPVKDKDYVVVGATPAQMLALGYEQVGKDFPVFLHPKSKQEYALARTERKSGKGYTGFICDTSASVTLEDDLRRRDLTVNAMAQSEHGDLIDPYGGQQDLDARVLRHVSDAFIEDPLRVLRVARFAARYHQLGFTIANETMALMTQISQSEELSHLSAERVWQETQRSLQDPAPRVYFEVLRACAGLTHWFPEIDALWGVPNPPKHHPEIDTGLHTMMVLEQACLLSDSVAVRFAALVHDLGKALTPPEKWPSHHGHGQLGLAAINALCDRLKAPNDCRELALLVSEFHGHIHTAPELKPSTLLKVFNRCDVWRKPERFEQLLLACEADARGRTGFELLPYPQADYVRTMLTAALSVDIKAIVASGIKGPEIKAELEAQRQQAIADAKQTWTAQAQL